MDQSTPSWTTLEHAGMTRVSVNKNDSIFKQNCYYVWFCSIRFCRRNTEIQFTASLGWTGITILIRTTHVLVRDVQLIVIASDVAPVAYHGMCPYEVTYIFNLSFLTAVGGLSVFFSTFSLLVNDTTDSITRQQYTWKSIQFQQCQLLLEEAIKIRVTSHPKLWNKR